MINLPRITQHVKKCFTEEAKRSRQNGDRCREKRVWENICLLHFKLTWLLLNAYVSRLVAGYRNTSAKNTSGYIIYDVLNVIRYHWHKGCCTLLRLFTTSPQTNIIENNLPRREGSINTRQNDRGLRSPSRASVDAIEAEFTAVHFLPQLSR